MADGSWDDPDVDVAASASVDLAWQQCRLPDTIWEIAMALGWALQSPAARIAVATLIMTIDGFASFSLSLMAPFISRDLGLPTESLGLIFASVMAGMTIGAFFGGALADKFGRLRVLLLVVGLFGITSVTMPLAHDAASIIVNRFLGGIGFGAVGPVVTALQNREGEKPPGEFAISLVWSGIALGGALAALFNYLFTEAYGWGAIFFVGGIATVPIVALAWWTFCDNRGVAATARKIVPPQIGKLFADGQAPRTFVATALFFFGFVATAIIVFWLPTILSNRDVPNFVISATFAAVNVGAIVAIPLIGFLASYGPSGRLRTITFALVALCGFGAALATFNSTLIAILAVAGFMIGTGAQTLAVAFANELHRPRGLQGTSVGVMTAFGRLGSFLALSVSGTIAAVSGRETMVFALGGAAAALAAVLSLVANRQAETPPEQSRAHSQPER